MNKPGNSNQISIFKTFSIWERRNHVKKTFLYRLSLVHEKFVLVIPSKPTVYTAKLLVFDNDYFSFLN